MKLERAMIEKEAELEKLKGEHNDILQTQQGSLEKLQEEHSNVSTDLQKLMQENNELRKENEQYIENIKRATNVIYEVVEKIQRIHGDRDMSSKFKNYYDEINGYIQSISNALQGNEPQTAGKKGRKGKKSMKNKRKTKKMKRKSVKKYFGGLAHRGGSIHKGGYVYKNKRSTKRFSSRFTKRRSSR
jgi:chromosome segregation ATPase